MSQEERFSKDFIGYEYREIAVSEDKLSFYLDCYENFGWMPDENMPLGKGIHQTTINLKRNRKIINKMELTRLQRHFEACMNEIEKLEQSKTSAAYIWSLTVGIIGTAFMAGSVFAVTHEPPVIWLCILLAIPAFLGWAMPYFIFQAAIKRQAQKLEPLIEEKYDEIYRLCEKGHSLL